MFETHKLNPQGSTEITRLKGTMNYACSLVMPLIPDGRDKSIFITKMEEAMFFATRAIASKEGNYSEIIGFAPATETTGETNVPAKQ